MTELAIQVLKAEAEPYAAVPTLSFRLRLKETTGARIHSIALRCQLRIEPQRRRYSPEEERRLLELFGETPRWGDTLKPFLWTHVSTLVPGFQGATESQLSVPCTYDFEVAASKYLHSLDGGEIPVLLLYSGTVFAEGETGLQVTPLPWDRDSSYRLPVRVWRDLMDLYFPNGGWLRLRRETLDGLMRFKARRALASWDEVVETLLNERAEAPQ